MTSTEKANVIATFRFGVIADLVNGRYLHYGDKEQLLREKSKQTYNIPFSSKRSISRESILAWIRMYYQGGKRIESLYNKIRKDKGTYRALDATIRLGIKEIKRDKPNLRCPALINELRHRKILTMDEYVNLSTIYRFLKNEKLHIININAQDRRTFEAEFPNQIWQADIMHGYHIFANGKKRKPYLIGIIDDHSRLIIHAEFYLADNLQSLRHALKEAFLSRGLPQTLYIDNGSSFRSLHLEQITASLGIGIKHTPPYTPEGRGKIEKWFRFVRENFFPGFKGKTLDELNLAIHCWVDWYNNKIHGTTGMSPLQRFQNNIECVRPSPKDIDLYFRFVEHRRVKKDRSFRLNGRLYEAPVGLIDRTIEVKFLEDKQDNVEIFFDNISFGLANPVDPHINAKIGRVWTSRPKNKKTSDLSILTETTPVQSGQLPFGQLPVGGINHD
jgi:transposase InsO family protein